MEGRKGEWVVTQRRCDGECRGAEPVLEVDVGAVLDEHGGGVGAASQHGHEERRFARLVFVVDGCARRKQWQ